VTNYGTLAILALPWLPERQLRFLLALETVTGRDGDWREISTGLLARQARLSVRTVIKARAELVESKRIEYRPGTGPGHPGKHRLLFDVDKPGKNAAPVNRCKQPPATGANASRNRCSPNAPASANANAALEPSALESSSARPRAPARPRGPAGMIRAAYPGATDDDIEIIIKERTRHARSVEAVIAHEIRHGLLRLPCDRDGPQGHSNACRDGNGPACGMAGCTCRCHTEPLKEAAP
jgi:hypothetical protein